MSSFAPSFARATAERSSQLADARNAILSEVQAASSALPSSRTRPPRLVAVSKLKPSSDILACYEACGQMHYGENYIQELTDKANELPQEIKWHFIGTLQSNKAKGLASIRNLYAVETLASVKAATQLAKGVEALSPPREERLNVYLQVNTSGEDAKSGVSALVDATGEAVDDAAAKESELAKLARHVLTDCSHALKLKGVMTIGAWDSSHAATGADNPDFAALGQTRDTLERILRDEMLLPQENKDGEDDASESEGGEPGRLELSMGMSADFAQAVKQGSDNVRVGSSIFGERPPRK